MKKFEFTIKGNKYATKLVSFDDNVAIIEVNGTEYEIEVHQDVKTSKTPRLVRKPVAKKVGEGVIKKKAGGVTVTAPLPGSIFKILVKPGDVVKTGDNLLIMEAMKMENDIKAEKDGVVSSIKVKEGDTILQGEVLIEM